MPVPENLSLFQGKSKKGRLSGMHSPGETLRAEKNLTGAEASRGRGKVKLKSVDEAMLAMRSKSWSEVELLSSLADAVFNLATALNSLGYRETAEENIPENIRGIFYEK